MDCVFIGYTVNSCAYRFLVDNSELSDIHVKIIIESRDDVFFEDVFPHKWEEDKTSEKRTHETTFRIEDPREPIVNAKVKLRSTRSRISESFGADFITHAFESEPQTFKEVMSTSEAQI